MLRNFLAGGICLLFSLFTRAQDPGLDSSLTYDYAAKAPCSDEAIAAAVQRNNRLYGTAFVNADSLLFVRRYDNNAWIMPPQMNNLTGPAAAGTFYSIAYRKMGIRNVILKTSELYCEGMFATEVGSFELRAAGEKPINKGKYVVLWIKRNGEWKMYRDCFNSDN